MSTFIVDSSTIISLASTCLLDVFKKYYDRGNRFIIPQWVYDEVVNRPMRIEKFQFEGYRVKKLVDAGVFEVYNKKGISKEATTFANYINNVFFAKGHPIKIIHPADSEGIFLTKKLGDALIVDERNMRLVIENPIKIKNILQHRLHTKIEVNKENLNKALDFVGKVPVLRSVDLVSIAWERGLVDFKNNKNALKAMLLSLKFAGCAISFDEIFEYLDEI